ncbi:PREDICTED: SAP30-binding protein-like isoform X2 [Populus euphratica]|uniref:SAP30-binding protein-like isoform X2 n=1 Tax=Populus euphratica TaxID=75702 RepID=A0AAJ6SW91_POPEU|nr:PREDICTED: SAP30-binding protein-like isoform X2 [Populus euphratica]
MASRKKQLEGIALLSMYNDDEEDDEEMEDLHYQQPHNDMEEDALKDDNAMATEAEAATYCRNSTPKGGILRLLKPQQQGGTINLETKRSNRGGTLAIVDYGHGEVAMSPEPEEVEFEEKLQSVNGVIQEKSSPGTAHFLSPSFQATPQSFENLGPSQLDEINDTTNESEAVNTEGANEVPAEGVNPFDKFLPPPPKEKCLEELQRKIDKFLALKKIGRSFNSEVCNKKDYRNPDFLLHAVRYQVIDEIGSCFRKDVFDPHGYDQSDYYLELEVGMRRERERKERESKRSTKVERVMGGIQPGVVVPPAKFSMPIPVFTASGMRPSSNAADAAPLEVRQNKKSKWDKVDGDGRNLLTGGQDSLAAAAAAQAALLSAANVGSGYTGFVQQKRREAEERRSGERKLERRS